MMSMQVEIGFMIWYHLQYILLKLGLSRNFGFVDEENLVSPTHMYVDWVRVYQHPDRKNFGCDPPEFPTQAYISECVSSCFLLCLYTNLRAY